MPSLPLPRCADALCDKKVAQRGQSRCPEHRRQQHTEHNTRREVDARYSSAQWRRLRKYKILSEAYCENCARHGRTVAAQEVDHIQPVKKGGIFFDLKNLQSLCKTCHSIKTASERSQQG